MNAHDPSTPDETSAEQLSRSYENLLEQPGWEVDQPEAGEGSRPASVGLPENAEAPPPSPVRIVEALLFVGGAPLTPAQAGDIVRGLTPEQFVQAIDALNRDYRRQGRPYVILAQEHGYVLTLRPNYRSVVEKLYGGVREARLSPAAIDVLALLAYRQPATKAEIDALRGAESGLLLRQLVRRGLATVLQRGEADRKHVTYGTTRRFLELFGLTSLDDLPRTQDLQQI
jgi:segregation and condensation protein B